jgi:hypothetical protein
MHGVTLQPLVVHDRSINAGTSSLIPGAGSIVFAGGVYENDLQFNNMGTSLNFGPVGALDNTTIDLGASSSHGYAQSNSLPANARVHVAHQVTLDNAVTIEYPLGSGAVIYSGIPLDFYLGQAPGTAWYRPGFSEEYRPNIIAYALDLSQSYYEIYRCTEHSEVGSCGNPVVTLPLNALSWDDHNGEKIPSISIG